MSAFLAALDAAPLGGDGPTSLLLAAETGAPCAEALCLTDPDRVRAHHATALAAGARVIRTNSTRANRPHLTRFEHGHSVNEINWHAAQLARQALTGQSAWIAGSVGPLDPGVTDRRAHYLEHIGALLDGGVDLIVLEAFSELTDLVLAVEAKYELHHKPVVATLTVNPAGQLPSGKPAAEIFAALLNAEANLVGLAGTTDFATIEPILAHADPDLPIVLFSEDQTPDQLATWAESVTKNGARLLFTGANTTPSHTQALTPE